MKFEFLWPLPSEIATLFLYVFYEDHVKFFNKRSQFSPQTKFEQLSKGSFEKINSQRLAISRHIKNWVFCLFNLFLMSA